MGGRKKEKSVRNGKKNDEGNEKGTERERKYFLLLRSGRKFFFPKQSESERERERNIYKYMVRSHSGRVEGGEILLPE